MFFRLITETLRTLSVTTYHPVGWGLGKLNTVLRRKSLSEEELRIEHACPVLLVHGVFHNSTAFYAINRHLSAQGFKTLETIELWTAVHRIEKMAEELKSRVEVLHDQHVREGRYGKVRIVAHSLGGLVLRTALQDLEFASKIDKIIFLGVPHQGSLLHHLPYPRFAKKLAPNSEFMKMLREIPLPGNIHYWNLRGTMDVVTPSKDTLLPHVPNLYFDGVGHAGLLSARRVLQAIVSILETPLYDRPLYRVKDG